MTVFFRCLADLRGDGVLTDAIQPAFYGKPIATTLTAWEQWLERYLRRVEGIPEDQRRLRMNAYNPWFILRNYLAQEAIEAAEEGDMSMVERLLDASRRPYDVDPDTRNPAASVLIGPETSPAAPRFLAAPEVEVGPIAYLLGRYPTVSNTFVYREIAQLGASGVGIQVYALTGSTDPDHGILDRKAIRRVPSASAVLRMHQPSAELADAWRAHGGREKDLRRAGWLAARWSRDGVAAVHAHFLGSAAALAAVACEIAQIPLVVSVHARGILIPDAMTHFTMQRVAEIRTISERTAALVTARIGRLSRVLPLAVDPAPVAPGSSGPFHVLTVARPVAKKGYPTLRAAISRLSTPVRWTVVGATEAEIGGSMNGSTLGAVPFLFWKPSMRRVWIRLRWPVRSVQTKTKSRPWGTARSHGARR